MIRSLAGATIVTPDLDAAVAAYRDFLGYEGEIGALEKDAAALWGVPEATGARIATLHPASGKKRFIRLVEGVPAPDFRPLASFGWTAIEIVVQQVDRLAEKLADSPFRIIGPPAVLDFEFTDKLKAMQVVGPGGEILYLTQIGGEIPGFDLPTADSFVDHPFIMVLASPDIADVGSFYDRLGRPISPEMTAPVRILSDAFGLPAEHKHRLATVAFDDCSLLEVDAFPPQTVARPRSSIGLPSGIAMVSLFGDVSALGANGPLMGRAGEWIEFLDGGECSINNKNL